MAHYPYPVTVEENRVFVNSETKFKEIKFKNPLHVHIDDEIKTKKVTDGNLLTKNNVNKNEEQIKTTKRYQSEKKQYSLIHIHNS